MFAEKLGNIKASDQRGFTLVEIAIVMVIIGLLLGGILKGQAMIENAKVKRIKKDVDSIVAATYGYQDKYGVLPGDDPADRKAAPPASLGATGCTGGNGDGYFSAGLEQVCAWQELYGAGFLNGDASDHTEATTAKRHPFGGRYLFRYGTHNNMYGNYIFIDNVPFDIAQELDEKYDDGIYNSGTIQANGDYTTAGNRDMYWYAF